MRKIIFWLLIPWVIFLVGCSHAADKNATSKFPVSGFEDVPEMIVVDSGDRGDETSTGKTKEISVTARQWEFEPNPIIVSKGDKVKLSIKSIDVTHGFALPDFGINSRLNPGETTVIEFMADKTGSFSFFCSVQCGSGHGDMRGTLIVNE